jgi:hypothetical protein
MWRSPRAHAAHSPQQYVGARRGVLPDQPGVDAVADADDRARELVAEHHRRADPGERVRLGGDEWILRRSPLSA